MKKYIVLFLALGSFQISLAQITNSNIVAELNVVTTDNVSTIVAKALNRTDVYLNLKYVFSVVTFDKNYKSAQVTLKDFLDSDDVSEKTLQDFINSNNASEYTSKETAEDFFTLDPYQSKDLFRTSMVTANENKIIVLILIYDEDNKLMAMNRIVFNEEVKQNKIKEEEAIQANSFELSGLVVEETLTKNGKDFYDQFYFYYSYNNVKGNKVVVIDEMFTFRSRTKIIVKIGDEEIFSFFGSSNDEYIDEMAKISVQKVYKYFENKKKEKLYITPY